MENQYRCIVDSKWIYRDYVYIVNGEIQYGELAEGDQLIEAYPPNLKSHAGAEGFIKPIFQNGKWAEAATASAIEEWDQLHPAPEPEAPSPIEALQAENNLLKAQVTATADRQEFLEDCIAEMAVQVYNA